MVVDVWCPGLTYIIDIPNMVSPHESYHNLEGTTKCTYGVVSLITERGLYFAGTGNAR